MFLPGRSRWTVAGILMLIAFASGGLLPKSHDKRAVPDKSTPPSDPYEEFWKQHNHGLCDLGMVSQRNNTVCCLPTSCKPGYGLVPCNVNGTEDICQQCSEGYIQLLNVSSLDITNTDCFKPSPNNHQKCPLDDFHAVKEGSYSKFWPYSCECAVERCLWKEPNNSSVGTCATVTTCPAHQQLNKSTGKCDQCPWYADKDQPGCWPCVINVGLLRLGRPDPHARVTLSPGYLILIVFAVLLPLLNVLTMCFACTCMLTLRQNVYSWLLSTCYRIRLRQKKWQQPSDYFSKGLLPVLVSAKDSSVCIGGEEVLDLRQGEILQGKAAATEKHCFTVNGTSPYSAESLFRNVNEKLCELPGKHKNVESCEADLKDLSSDISAVLRNDKPLPDGKGAEENSSLESPDFLLEDYEKNTKIDEGATPAIATRPIARVGLSPGSVSATATSVRIDGEEESDRCHEEKLRGNSAAADGLGHTLNEANDPNATLLYNNIHIFYRSCEDVVSEDRSFQDVVREESSLEYVSAPSSVDDNNKAEIEEAVPSVITDRPVGFVGLMPFLISAKDSSVCIGGEVLDLRQGEILQGRAAAAGKHCSTVNGTSTYSAELLCRNMNERMLEFPGRYKNLESCEADLKDLPYDINVVLQDKIYFPDVICAEKNSSLESTDSSLVDYKNNSKIDEGATPAIAPRPIARVAPFGRQSGHPVYHSNVTDHSNISSGYGLAHMSQPLSHITQNALPFDPQNALPFEESEVSIDSRHLVLPRHTSSTRANAGSLSPLPRSTELQMQRLKVWEHASETVPKTVDYDEDDMGLTVEPQGLPDQTERKEAAYERHGDEQTEVKRVAGLDED